MDEAQEETLRLQIDESISCLILDNAKKLCNEAGLELDEAKLSNIRIIKRCLQKLADGLDTLEGLQGFMGLCQKHSHQTGSQGAEAAGMNSRDDAINKEKKGDMEGDDDNDNKCKTNLSYLFSHLGNLREFKIRGSIGEVGQREKLSFVSLSRQIQEGKEKGYQDQEIIRAVINAISPGLHLRNVLESTPSLTLRELTVFLRSHYGEKNTTELCQSLSQLTQAPNESEIEFVYRAMSLRQQVVLASKSDSTDIAYSDEIVKRIFLKSLETGLRSSSLITELRPLLRLTSTTDEDLLKAVVQASTSISEWKDKQKKPLDSKIHHIDHTDGRESEPNNHYRESNIARVISDLKEELIGLKQEVRQLKSKPDDKTSTQNRRLKMACDVCLSQSKGQSCFHCKHCGSSDHYARKCKLNQKASGNGQRLGQN